MDAVDSAARRAPGEKRHLSIAGMAIARDFAPSLLLFPPVRRHAANPLSPPATAGNRFAKCIESGRRRVAGHARLRYRLGEA
jgi:hypothetical protein